MNASDRYSLIGVELISERGYSTAYECFR